MICLIPKDDCCLIELSNWRPLTLLNVDYKILAKVIGQRIESTLSSLIHTDQTGFVKGRFIGQNVRLLNDIREYADAKKLPGVLLILFTSVLNYTTLVQISGNGYPFFATMLKVAC